MKEDRHILYEDEDGEVQVHEPLDLSSDEEGDGAIEVRPPVILDKVVVGMKHQLRKLEQEMAHVKAARVMIQEEEDEKEKRYKVLPSKFEEEIDAEIADINETVGLEEEIEEDPEYRINPEDIDGAGAITVDNKTVLTAEGEEREAWIKAIKEEIGSIVEKGVKEDLDEDEVYERYCSQVREGNVQFSCVRLPAKLVLTEKPLHDGTGRFKKEGKNMLLWKF